MQARLTRLREKEEDLDRLCRAMRENYKQAKNSPSNDFYAYVTRDDLLNVYGEDSVILTVRNFDTLRKGEIIAEDGSIKHTLRVNGRWKKVDVRLVTTDGEITRNTRNRTSEEPSTDGESSETNKTISASQPESKTNATGNRRPGRRRKPERFELKDDDSSVESDQAKRFKPTLTEEEQEKKEKEERQVTADILLKYRPTRVQRKRNLDEDWLECRYNYFHVIYFTL